MVWLVFRNKTSHHYNSHPLHHSFIVTFIIHNDAARIEWWPNCIICNGPRSNVFDSFALLWIRIRIRFDCISSLVRAAQILSRVAIVGRGAVMHRTRTVDNARQQQENNNNYLQLISNPLIERQWRLRFFSLVTFICNIFRTNYPLLACQAHPHPIRIDCIVFADMRMHRSILNSKGVCTIYHFLFSINDDSHFLISYSTKWLMAISNWPISSRAQWWIVIWFSFDSN